MARTDVTLGILLQLVMAPTGARVRICIMASWTLYCMNTLFQQHDIDQEMAQALATCPTITNFYTNVNFHMYSNSATHLKNHA